MRRHRSTNITGTVIVRDSDSGGEFKSKLEKHGFTRWMCNSDVESVLLQKPGIKYMDEQGKPRRYTGDLLVRFYAKVRRRPLVVECKYARELQGDPALVRKLERVEEAMNRLGYDFLTQTEKDIHAEGFPMMKFVFSHRNNDPHPAREEILNCVALHKSLTLGQLVSALRKDEVARLELIPEVWRLVAMHQLRTDFAIILNHEAKISMPSV